MKGAIIINGILISILVLVILGTVYLGLRMLLKYIKIPTLEQKIKLLQQDIMDIERDLAKEVSGQVQYELQKALHSKNKKLQWLKTVWKIIQIFN